MMRTVIGGLESGVRRGWHGLFVLSPRIKDCALSMVICNMGTLLFLLCSGI